MIDQAIRLAVAYLEWGVHFILSKVMTLEGIITLVFGLFLIGLVSRIRAG